MTTTEQRTGRLEVRSIDYVPLNERHGKIWCLQGAAAKALDGADISFFVGLPVAGYSTTPSPGRLTWRPKPASPRPKPPNWKGQPAAQNVLTGARLLREFARLPHAKLPEGTDLGRDRPRRGPRHAGARTTWNLRCLTAIPAGH